MSMSTQQKVMLNDVIVDFVSLKIKIQNEWVDVESRQLALLSLLLKKQGEAVSREQIMDALWGDVIVSDNSVSQLVTQLRKSLHDNKSPPQIIRTIPRIGYQLIANVSEPPTLFDKARQHSPKKVALFGVTGIVVGVISTLFLQYLFTAKGKPTEFNYRARVTSAPGTEAFLRYSPDGRYLAFSQSNELQNQFDLAVFDQQSQTVHNIKSSGYSEEAPVWSPDGQWLAYYRYDPLRCDIRIIGVNNAIETWRLSPEYTLTQCQPSSAPTRLKWYKPDALFGIVWHDNQPRLMKYTLSLGDKVRVQDTTLIGEFKPLAFDISAEGKMLIVEKQGMGYTLSEVNLYNLSEQRIISRQQYKQQPIYGAFAKHIWSVEDELMRSTLQGVKHSLHKPMGFIASLDVNPVNGDVAHAEGLAQINAYQLSLHKGSDGISVDKTTQLASSTRMDFMPTVSSNGEQVAFISVQRPGVTRYSQAEIWIKHQRRKGANRVAQLPSHITPKYLQFSPNGDTLLLLDERQNVYLINSFSRRLVPVISGFEQLNAVRWSDDSQTIFYQAKSQQGEWQDWQYDLQLSSNSLKANNVTPRRLSPAQPLWQLNPSYINYEHTLRVYLSAALEQHIPLSQLLPSLSLYKPALFDGGMYYILREGHQLSLYCYVIASQENIFIKKLGAYGLDIGVSLTMSSSVDGAQLVFSQVDGIETDILLHQVVN